MVRLGLSWPLRKPIGENRGDAPPCSKLAYSSDGSEEGKPIAKGGTQQSSVCTQVLCSALVGSLCLLPLGLVDETD